MSWVRSLSLPKLTRVSWKMSKADLTYCDLCLRNLPDEKFDYRFDKPVCLECGEKIEPDDPEYPREKIEGEDD